MCQLNRDPNVEQSDTAEIPLVLTLLTPTFFGSDASKASQNSFVVGLQKLDNQKNIIVPFNEINYGITDNIPWFEVQGQRFISGRDPLPKYCICRCDEDDVIYHIQAMGIPCFPNPRITQFFESKRRMMAFASSLGIPCIDSIFGSYDESPKELEYPIIVKPANGFAGANIRKVTDDLTRHGAEYAVCKSKYNDTIWQKALPSGDDLRIYMLGTNPYCAVFRETSTLKANLKFSPKTYYLTVEQIEQQYPDALSFAKIIANAIDGEAGLYSVDFLFDDGTKKQRKVVFGEVSIGNLGTKLLKDNKPDYVSDYIHYIENRLLEK